MQRPSTVLGIVQVSTQLAHGVKVLQARRANCVIYQEPAFCYLLMCSKHVRSFTGAVSTSLSAEQAAKNGWLFGFNAFMRVILEGVAELSSQLLVEH